MKLMIWLRVYFILFVVVLVFDGMVYKEFMNVLVVFVIFWSGGTLLFKFVRFIYILFVCNIVF